MLSTLSTSATPSPSVEWETARAAVRAWAPELAPWTEWTHGRKAEILLPGGAWATCDRGAEQGDPLGPAYCGLVLLGCADHARAAVEAHRGGAWGDQGGGW